MRVTECQLYYHKHGYVHPIIFSGSLEIDPCGDCIFIRVFDGISLTDGILIAPGEYFKVVPIKY
jgi:hypothetical protein